MNVMEYRYLFEIQISFLLYIHPEVGLLDHASSTVFYILGEITILLSVAKVQFWLLGKILPHTLQSELPTGHIAYILS